MINFVGYVPKTKDNKPSLFFEYAMNGSLDTLISKKNPVFNSTRKSLCALEICAGMKHLHSMKIIHRDLKPQNILVTDRIHFKICDFGESVKYDGTSTLSEGIGTLYYMSPEIAYGSSYDFKTDVFSFGVILFVLVTGGLPKIGVIDFMNGKKFDIPQDVTPFVSDLIISCLSMTQEKRPSFEEIIEIMKANNFMIFPDVDQFFVLERYHQLSC